VRELQGLILQPIPSLIRADCLALLRALDGQIRRLDAELRARWGSDLRVQRLMTIPGVGPFIAIVLVLELGNIQRFPSGKHLASYIGLTPRVRASADRIRTGHISKEGNRLVRWVLVLAATQAARRPGPLRAWFRAIKQRKGTQIARVALARRLAEIVYHMWKDECDYFAVLRRGVVRG
jgi:transposase